MRELVGSKNTIGQNDLSVEKAPKSELYLYLLHQAFSPEFPSSELPYSAESRCQIVHLWLLFITLNIITGLCTETLLRDATN